MCLVYKEFYGAKNRCREPCFVLGFLSAGPHFQQTKTLYRATTFLKFMGTHLISKNSKFSLYYSQLCLVSLEFYSILIKGPKLILYLVYYTLSRISITEIAPEHIAIYLSNFHCQYHTKIKQSFGDIIPQKFSWPFNPISHFSKIYCSNSVRFIIVLTTLYNSTFELT